MDSSSSWRVVAPSARAEMVRVATRIGSTPRRPSEHEATELTILLTSTGSYSPLRLRTRMPMAVSIPAAGPESGISSMPAVAMVGAASVVVAWLVSVVVSVDADCSVNANASSPRFPVAGGRMRVRLVFAARVGASGSEETVDDNDVA